MSADDRWAALICLAISVGAALLALYLLGLIVEILDSRPIVTKDQFTGDLHIPRSNLTIGQGRCHHDW